MGKLSTRTVAILLLLTTSWAFAQPKDIPVHADVSVTAPAENIPKELAAYSGRWLGQYNGVNTGAYMSDGLIVVEKITSPSEIQVFYSGIGRHRINHGQPWTYRINAIYVDGALEFKVSGSGGCTIKAKMTGDRTISVTKDCARGSNRASYRRIGD